MANITAYQNFLLKVLQASLQRIDKPQGVYPLLQVNLSKLDDGFVEYFYTWAAFTLSTVEPRQAQDIAIAIKAFSDVIKNFPLGNRAVNLEIAITGYEAAANFFTRAPLLPELLWGETQCNLSLAYNNRIRGNKAENLETAISAGKKSLEIFTRKESHTILGANVQILQASVQNNLGLAYRNRIYGEQADNIEQAICYFKAAFELLNRETLASEWAKFQHNLGNAYAYRILGDRAENLEKAIKYIEEALEVYTKETLPKDWANAQNTLGFTYHERIRGDRAENLEKAITCYQAALQVLTREAFPQFWAQTQMNLASVYRDRIFGNRSKNLEMAIETYESALQVSTKEAFPEQWAMTQNNLGMAYSRRCDSAENQERAIAAYKAALQVYTRNGFPMDWARTQKNLGLAYSIRISGNRQENLEKAMTAYQAASQIFTRDAFTYYWAKNQNNLAIAYTSQGQIDEAIACCRSALEVFTPTAFPSECFITARQFGEIAARAKRWAESIEGYSVAIEAVETSRTWTISESRRQEILAEAFDIYHNLVQVCINAGQLEKAIETIERSRSKRLVDLMASNDLYQGGEIPPEVKELLQQFDNLQQRIDQERLSSNSADSQEAMRVGTSTLDRTVFQAKTQVIASLEAEKQQVWQQLRRLDPVLAGEIQVITPDFSAMQKLIDQPNTAILSFYSTSNDTHIFVLRQNQIACHTCTGEGIATLQSWILQNWLKLYVEDGNIWKSQISNFLVELAERLQINDLISQHLQNITELILVPHLALHQIPFGALPLEEDKYLGDKFLIRYTPSCQVLEFCQQRGEVEGNLTYGIVEDATEDLPFASFEGEQIAKIYNIPESDRLRGRSQATTSNYRQLASRVQALHSSHHAESCLDNPLNGA
ncbi:tetratricopeptide repeat protein [Trichocoleus sp. ST-U3]|uniref:CHAT domain-containing protein n=1 Tax=Coleofasciculus sp. FACHB-542 TaxID=2692787 RepID=UPI00168A1F55|nr:tetratricopeptide repeat protein [Coleofasciculus sp. FACHB-542]MBD2085329.1 tetratricopeptide repeat protein [Coleofasciculus sp. FACHB-542]